MIPRILEYEDGRVKVTAECFAIPELKALLDKFGTDAEPYLAYAHYMTAPNSPYVNLPENEKEETIIFDLSQSFPTSDFNATDDTLEEAVKKLESLYTSTVKRYHDSLKISIDKMSTYLRTKEITEGRDGNLAEIIRIQKEGLATIRNFKDIEKMVDEEMTFKMKGKDEMGEY